MVIFYVCDTPAKNVLLEVWLRFYLNCITFYTMNNLPIMDRFVTIYKNTLWVLFMMGCCSWQAPKNDRLNSNLNGSDWSVVSASPGEGEKNRYFANNYPKASAIAAKVPGDINWDLMRSGTLPDIFLGMNAKKSYPYALQEWWYRKTFTIDRKQWENKKIKLNFSAVDYAAKFWLNGKFLGRHVGQFTPFSFEIKDHINFENENELIVLIEPAPANIIEAFINGNRWATNAYSVVNETLKFWKSRTMTGWDWGTRLWSMGIWQDVFITGTSDIYLDRLLIYNETKHPYHQATLQVKLNINAQQAREVKLVYSAECINKKAPQGHSTKIIKLGNNQPQITHVFDIKAPALWWPNGYGAQNLYLLKVTAIDIKTGKVLDVISSRFGIRDIEVVENPGAKNFPNPTKTIHYLTKINGQQLFLHGGNWLPADLLFGRPDKKEYEHLIRMAVLANYNALRIWSGGLIEKQLFYDLCDEYGILIYQEMPNVFAPPLDTPEIVQNMAQEQREVMPLLINHPSVFRYGFGNELDLFRENSKHVRQYEDIASELDPHRPAHGSDPNPTYQRHGPYYFGFPTGYAAYNTGIPQDHGPINAVEVTEYSVSGASSFETIEKIIPEKVRWPISSLDTLKKILPDFPKELTALPTAIDSMWLWHNGLASFGPLTWLVPDIYRSLFGEQPTLQAEIRSSQFAQAEGYRYAHQSHRRAAWHRSGIFMWTFNEPWPNAAHGSIVEYYGKPKMAFYYTRNAFAPITISAPYHSMHLHPGDTLALPLFVHNARIEGKQKAILKTQIQDLSGKLYFTQNKSVDIESMLSQKVDSIQFQIPSDLNNQVLLVRIALENHRGQSLSTETYTFGIRASDPKKTPYMTPLLQAPKAKVKVTVRKMKQKKWGKEMMDVYEAKVINNASAPALFVNLQYPAQPDEVYFTDGYFILLPGEERKTNILVSTKGTVPFNIQHLQLHAWNTESTNKE
jgi:beta-mannosidase